jgi:hypothetical protein
MKAWQWILLIVAIVVIGAIVWFYFKNKKKSDIVKEKGADGTEGWLLKMYNILKDRGGLKKGSNFQESMDNFDNAVKKVRSLSQDELAGLGYDPGAEEWLRAIWRGYAAGQFSTMEEAIRKNVEYAKNNP